MQQEQAGKEWEEEWAGLFPVYEGGKKNLKTKGSDLKQKSCDWEDVP